MTDFQQRVIDERAALEDKISKLDAFIHGNAAFLNLPSHEQERLIAQSRVMKQYSVILAERIWAF